MVPLASNPKPRLDLVPIVLYPKPGVHLLCPKLQVDIAGFLYLIQTLEKLRFV